MAEGGSPPRPDVGRVRLRAARLAEMASGSGAGSQAEIRVPGGDRIAGDVLTLRVAAGREFAGGRTDP